MLLPVQPRVAGADRGGRLAADGVRQLVLGYAGISMWIWSQAEGDDSPFGRHVGGAYGRVHVLDQKAIPSCRKPSMQAMICASSAAG